MGTQAKSKIKILGRRTGYIWGLSGTGNASFLLHPNEGYKRTCSQND
jgi:hypothetical protein